MKTSELQGAALDYAVAIGVGLVSDETPKYAGNIEYSFKPSTNWQDGGPIIERKSIEICQLDNGEWRAQLNAKGCGPYCRQYGPTPLIAAMRCYVASELGEEINIPKEVSSI